MQSVSSFEPDAHFAGLVARFHMDDARTATNGAVLRISLPPASAWVHEKLLGLAAKRAGGQSGGFS
jgi:hypothetical protein